MSLLESIVFPNIVKVVSSDNYCSLHLQLDNRAPEYATSDGDISCERTFLVDVFALDSFTGNLETQAYISCIPQLFLGYFLLQF